MCRPTRQLNPLALRKLLYPSHHDIPTAYGSGRREYAQGTIDATPDTDEFDAIWRQVIPETRARGNDFHLPLSVAYARRLCDAYPQADRGLVLIATLLRDTGWAHVDEGRIISEEFIAKVTAIIDGHDTRQEAHSIEDALMRDADRAWRFDRVGIALASGWFGQTPDYYTDRLEHEIIPELITEAAIAMAHADLKRSRDLLKTAVLR